MRELVDDSVVQKYAGDIQACANANPDLTNTRKNLITAEVRDSIIAQSARPAQFNEYTIMLTIGSDLTTEVMKSFSTWHGGGFHSGDFTIDVFNSIARTEEGFQASLTSYVRSMYDLHQLPFVVSLSSV